MDRVEQFRWAKNFQTFGYDSEHVTRFLWALTEANESKVPLYDALSLVHVEQIKYPSKYGIHESSSRYMWSNIQKMSIESSMSSDESFRYDVCLRTLDLSGLRITTEHYDGWVDPGNRRDGKPHTFPLLMNYLKRFRDKFTFLVLDDSHLADCDMGELLAELTHHTLLEGLSMRGNDLSMFCLAQFYPLATLPEFRFLDVSFNDGLELTTYEGFMKLFEGRTCIVSAQNEMEELQEEIELQESSL